ncbi:hypothetical protein G9464_17295 [Halostella sp. JP-L12]|uniref:hypothetical protein n=1 Tax=Halostella TaxID=1843185 RepID=UPI0013CF176D|nr:MULTISPECIES: hypothetical protein [Halostella]NHN49330.1 hypothetical protein [Halostella sp. JP-L12]
MVNEEAEADERDEFAEKSVGEIHRAAVEDIDEEPPRLTASSRPPACGTTALVQGIRP